MTDFFAHLETPRAMRADDGAEPTEAGRFASAADLSAFALGGSATLTIVSKRTGTRFTYRIRFPRDKETGKVDRTAPLFVSVLNGPDNTRDYAYLGYIRGDLYRHGTKKSRIAANAPSAVAFEWFYRTAIIGQNLSQVAAYHDGCCGRCGRKLTVPESIRTGLGPECASKLGGF
jgi:hypothetical protein